MTCKQLWFFTVLCIFATGVFLLGVDASCRTTRLCCPKRNNSCFSHGYKENGKSQYGRCFCDYACTSMQDCCHDYRTACVGVDCEVSAFSDWSNCDNECGIGVQVRRRHVVVFPENGGKRCPPLKQRRGCMGDNYQNCLQTNIFIERELREVAKILPARFGQHRLKEQYDPLRDGLRKNLFVSRNHSINEIPKEPAYCAQFEVVHRECNETDDWVATLQPGNSICLECQPLVMSKSLGLRCRGHGVFNEITDWDAVGVNKCRGRWRMKTKRESCTCDLHGKRDFILL